MVAFAVENQRESGVQERIVLNHRLDDMVAELVVFEDGGIGGEFHECAVFLIWVGHDAALFHHKSLLIGDRGTLTVACGANVEVT